ncbi:MAG: hypothetical protein NC230_09055 [Bacteroides sp.]|nr:hypothetical protein [Bacteroides sp.]
MIQAARSGKQNIIEGYAGSSTSAKTEIKLVNVAKASLKELLEDNEDFVKTRNFPKWEKRHLISSVSRSAKVESKRAAPQ